MKALVNFLSYFNCPKAAIRTLFITLGFVLVLFSSFAPAEHYQQEVQPGWLTPSVSGMEKLGMYKNNPDPNADLHLTVRKQTKAKIVKKLSPNTVSTDRSTDSAYHPIPKIAGFSNIDRPAYYTFLFRYTLF